VSAAAVDKVAVAGRMAQQGQKTSTLQSQSHQQIRLAARVSTLQVSAAAAAAASFAAAVGALLVVLASRAAAWAAAVAGAAVAVAALAGRRLAAAEA
jgi:predicted phage tail protein